MLPRFSAIPCWLLLPHLCQGPQPPAAIVPANLRTKCTMISSLSPGKLVKMRFSKVTCRYLHQLLSAITFLQLKLKPKRALRETQIGVLRLGPNHMFHTQTVSPPAPPPRSARGSSAMTWPEFARCIVSYSIYSKYSTYLDVH